MTMEMRVTAGSEALRRRESQRAIEVTRPMRGVPPSLATISGCRMSLYLLRGRFGGRQVWRAELELLGQLLDAVGLAGREVDRLAGVGRQVEQHPLAARRGDQLVAAVIDHAHGPVIGRAVALHQERVDPLLGVDAA